MNLKKAILRFDSSVLQFIVENYSMENQEAVFIVNQDVGDVENINAVVDHLIISEKVTNGFKPYWDVWRISSCDTKRVLSIIRPLDYETRKFVFNYAEVDFFYTAQWA